VVAVQRVVMRHRALLCVFFATLVECCRSSTNQGRTQLQRERCLP
jgi:hypothetical protein